MTNLLLKGYTFDYERMAGLDVFTSHHSFAIATVPLSAIRYGRVVACHFSTAWSETQQLQPYEVTGLLTYKRRKVGKNTEPKQQAPRATNDLRIQRSEPIQAGNG